MSQACGDLLGRLLQRLRMERVRILRDWRISSSWKTALASILTDTTLSIKYSIPIKYLLWWSKSAKRATSYSFLTTPHLKNQLTDWAFMQSAVTASNKGSSHLTALLVAEKSTTVAQIASNKIRNFTRKSVKAWKSSKSGINHASPTRTLALVSQELETWITPATYPVRFNVLVTQLDSQNTSFEVTLLRKSTMRTHLVLKASLQLALQSLWSSCGSIPRNQWHL